MDAVRVLQEVLENAINQRGTPYQPLFAVSVRFEADETPADQDQRTFFNFVKCINIPLAPNPPQSGNKYRRCTPRLDRGLLSGRVADVITTCKGRSLLLFHYANHLRSAFYLELGLEPLYLRPFLSTFLGFFAGHGGLNANGNVIFYARAPGVRSFDYIRTIERTLVDHPLLTELKLERTDVVIILDSCFSCNVIRATPSAERTVEVLAAVNADQRAFGNPSDSARIRNRTFTARLAEEVATTRRKFSSAIRRYGRSTT